MSDTKIFSFHYRSLDNKDIADQFAINDVANRELTYDDAITWDVPLRDFITFLSSVYGYDISEKVHYSSLSDRMAQLMETLEDYDDQSEEASSL